MSVLYRHPVIGMQLVTTLKGVIFVIVSHHTSMLTTQMNAYVRLNSIICVCILHDSIFVYRIVGVGPKISSTIVKGTIFAMQN